MNKWVDVVDNVWVRLSANWVICRFWRTGQSQYKFDKPIDEMLERYNCENKWKQWKDQPGGQANYHISVERHKAHAANRHICVAEVRQ